MPDSSNSNEDICQIEFFLSISPAEYLQYYRGSLKWVIVTSLCGKKVKFPAQLLTSHIKQQGIKGRFQLFYQTSGKAVELRKID